MGKFKRYRFRTKAVNDYRPLVFNPRYPWWCSGHSADETNVTIVAYLPADANLLTYWDDAYDIDYTDEDEIIFTDRFPEPEYYTNNKK